MVNILRKELIYALIVMLGTFNFGFNTAYPSPVVPYFQKEWNIPEAQTTWFNSICSLFAVFGPYISAFMCNYMGRRMVMCIIAIASAIFWAILLAMNKDRFALGIVIRALCGLTVGANSAMNPLVLVEIAPKDITGFFGNLNQFGLVFAMVWLYIQGVGNPWWSINVSAIVTNVLLAALIWLIPETRPEVKEEDSDGKPDEGQKESLFQKKYLGKLFVGIMMMVIQQFSGVNAIITNLDQNFRDVGVEIDSGYASAISVCAQLFAVFIGGLLIDWLGRRILFCGSCIGCGAFLFLFACNEQFKWATWLPIVFIFLYMFCFGAALGPVPWFVIPELFPDSVRSLASSLISSANWILSFIVIFVYPSLRGAIGNVWTIVIFGIVCVLGAVYGFFYITEPSKDGETLDWDGGDNIGADEGEKASPEL